MYLLAAHLLIYLEIIQGEIGLFQVIFLGWKQKHTFEKAFYNFHFLITIFIV